MIAGNSMAGNSRVKKTKKDMNYLDLVPTFAKNHTLGKNEEGMVTIFVENTGIMNRLAQKLLKKPKVSQVHPDEMGSFILPLIDGERNVNDIALLVKEHFGEKAEPLYDRLVTYMHTLESYGFIVMRSDSK